MQTDHTSNLPSLSRRQIFSILPAGLAGCLGCAASAVCAGQNPTTTPAHNPSEASGMSWQQVFGFAYRLSYIPAMNALADQIGKDKLMDMLKQGLSNAVKARIAAGPPTNRDFASFTKPLRSPAPILQHAIDMKVVEDTPTVFEFRISRCLWATTFRDQNAAELGYAGICHPDFATATAFNPKMRLIRTKTLMQGDDHCNHRYVVEA